MRKWASLKPDCHSAEGTSFKRIMVYSSTEGTSVFLYDSDESVFCSADEFYETEQEAMAEWEGKIDTNGWHFIDDPLPDCQHDSFLPIRVKGRNEGAPQWGKYEILRGGKWIDY